MVNLGNSLLVSNGVMWRKQRTLISPAFHFSALKPLVKLMDNCAQKMVSTMSAGESVSSTCQRSSFRNMTHALLCQASTKLRLAYGRRTYMQRHLHTRWTPSVVPYLAPQLLPQTAHRGWDSW